MKFSATGRNALASLGGRLWGNLISIAFVPMFLRLLGAEAYGLVGVFSSLASMFSVLDLGLSTTISRELARRSSSKNQQQESRDLLYTYQLLYVAAGVIIASAVIALADPIADHWLRPRLISRLEIRRSVRLIGIVLGFQWPALGFTGALIGLQRQTLLQSIRAIVATAQYGGAVVVLLIAQRTPSAFFVWQVVVSIANTAILMICIWRIMPTADRASQWRWDLVRSNLLFTLGTAGGALVVTALTQMDRVVLSRAVSLQAFGYYSIAASVAGLAVQWIHPLQSAVFPRLAELIGADNESEVSRLYHLSCQLVAAMAFAIGGILVTYPRQVLGLWFRDPATASSVAPILALLTIGSVLNSVMTIPAALQLAYGWTSLSLLSNLASLAVLAPLLFVFVHHWGALGAAAVWPLLNFGYVLFVIPIMHRRLLVGEAPRWYSNSFFKPLFAAGVTCSLSFIAFEGHTAHGPALIGWLAAASTATLITTTAATPGPRTLVLRTITR